MFQVARRFFLPILILSLLAACGGRQQMGEPANYAGDTPEMQAMIAETARQNDVPEALVHRIIQRESGYNPAARHGHYYGLMQILPETAATMGYRGPASGLLDAQTNLTYGVKYLRGAWLLSRGSYDRAEMWYSKGYYYEAKRRGMLVEVGLR